MTLWEVVWNQPIGQNKRYKKCPFFSFASSDSSLSFTFNFRFLYELKHKVHFSKTVCRIFHFRLGFIFIKAYIFVQQWAKIFQYVDSLTLKRHNSFQIEVVEKPHTVLLPDFWFLSCDKKFWNSMISRWVGAPQNLTWWQIF